MFSFGIFLVGHLEKKNSSGNQMNIKLFLTHLANSSVFKKSAHKSCFVSSHLLSLSRRISCQEAEKKRSPAGASSFPVVFSLPVIPKVFGGNGNVVHLQLKHRRLKFSFCDMETQMLEKLHSWKRETLRSWQRKLMLRSTLRTFRGLAFTENKALF